MSQACAGSARAVMVTRPPPVSRSTEASSPTHLRPVFWRRRVFMPVRLCGARSTSKRVAIRMEALILSLGFVSAFGGDSLRQPGWLARPRVSLASILSTRAGSRLPPFQGTYQIAVATAGKLAHQIGRQSYSGSDLYGGLLTVADAVAVIEVTVRSGPAPHTLTAEVIRSPAGEASAVSALGAGELLALRPELQAAVLTSSEGSGQLHADAERRIREVGETLFAAVLGAGEVAQRYRASAELATERGQALRIVLRISDPALARLPWEMMYDQALGSYVCRRHELFARSRCRPPQPGFRSGRPCGFLASCPARPDSPRFTPAGSGSCCRRRSETRWRPAGWS